MSRWRSTLTAVGVIAASAAVLTEGWLLVSYEAEEAAAFTLLESQTADKNNAAGADKNAAGADKKVADADKNVAAPDKGVSDAKRREEIRNAAARIKDWLSTPAVSARATKTRFLLSNALFDAAAEEKRLEDFLSLQPTAGEEWLRLAHLRWSRGATVGDILEALQMSSVTHPREFETVLYRTLDQIELWEFLPRDMHRTTMNDLADLARRVAYNHALLVREAVAAKSPKIQEAMKQELEARGDGGRFWLQALFGQH